MQRIIKKRCVTVLPSSGKSKQNVFKSCAGQFLSLLLRVNCSSFFFFSLLLLLLLLSIYFVLFEWMNIILCGHKEHNDFEEKTFVMSLNLCVC